MRKRLSPCWTTTDGEHSDCAPAVGAAAIPLIIRTSKHAALIIQRRRFRLLTILDLPPNWGKNPLRLLNPVKSMRSPGLIARADGNQKGPECFPTLVNVR